MGNWIKKDNLLAGMSEQLIAVEGTLKTLDGIISIIDTINTAISTVVNTVSTIASVPAIDPNFIALQEVQNNIKKWVDDFISLGWFVLPIFPSEVTGVGFDDIKGGVNNFKQKIIDSLYDIYDENRPTYNFDNYIASITIMYDTGVLADVYETAQNLLNIFQTFKFSYKIDIKTAPLETVESIAGDTKVVLQWQPSENGLQPDTYEIYRDGGVNPGKKKIGTVYPLSYPMRFEDTGLINNTPYVYSIVPYFLSMQQEEFLLVATPVLNQFDQSKKETACSNLGYIDTGNNTPTPHHCKLNNKAFYAVKCLEGRNVCSQYTNKKCKYDNNTLCTSNGYTTIKTRSYDKRGTIIPVFNSTLYQYQYCKDGTNAQVCDGYVEGKMYFNGTPPNWQSLTAKRFFPAELSPILDGLSSFTDFMVSSTQKSDTAGEVFGNELINAASDLKKQLLDLRNMIENLNDIFKVPIPTMYVLRVPTQYGGIDALVTALNTAQNGPQPNKNAYSIGFSLVYGSKSKEDVDIVYNVLKEIF